MFLKRFFACALLTLSLSLVLHAAPDDTPAVAVVRQFLADRAAAQTEKAYPLLSEESRRRIPSKVFAAGSPPPVDIIPSPALRALGAFTLDTHNTGGYHFEVVGRAS